LECRYEVASSSAVSLASAARVGEEHLGVGDPRQAGDLLGEGDLILDQIQRRGVEHLLGLLLDGLHHRRDLVAGHGGEDPAEEVEVLVAFGVDGPAAIAVDERDRLLVVESDPGGQNGLVAGEHVGMNGHGGRLPGGC
jgi:hypothetical protein